MTQTCNSPVGLWGRTTLRGAIKSEGFGEVVVYIRGGRECFYAKDADGGEIPADTSVLIVAYEAPRTVIVTPINFGEEESP
jgi:hypothetical protein